MAGSTVQTIPPKMVANGIKDVTMSDTTARPEKLQLKLLNRYRSPPRKHKIIVLFGEPGAGKSSLVNLMADKEVEITYPDCIQRRTTQWQEYTIDFSGDSYKLFEITGLDAPQLEIRESVKNAYRFRELDKQGEIDLLLFCVRAGRITAALQSNYRLFHEFLCEKKVPIVLAITNLEREQRMEHWWNRQQRTLVHYQVPVGHVWTTLDDLDEESCVTIRKPVEKIPADRQKQSWIAGDSMFASLMRKLKGLLVGGSSPVKRKDIVSRLTKRRGHGLSRQLADMIKQDVEAT